MMFMRIGIWGIVLQIALKRCEAAIHFLIYFVYTGVIMRTLYQFHFDFYLLNYEKYGMLFHTIYFLSSQSGFSWLFP